MDDDYRSKLDSIVHHAAAAEVAINAGKWDEASLEVAFSYEAAYSLQRILPHPNLDGSGLI